MKVVSCTLWLLCLISAMSCRKPDTRGETYTDSTIMRQYNIGVKYNVPLGIDVNGDEILDFTFSVSPIIQDGKTYWQYRMISLNDGRINCNYLDTPILWEEGQQPAYTNSNFQKWVRSPAVPLLEKVESENNNNEWQGIYKEKQEAPLAIQITLKEKKYFGYIYFSGKTPEGESGLFLHRSILSARAGFIFPA